MGDFRRSRQWAAPAPGSHQWVADEVGLSTWGSLQPVPFATVAYPSEPPRVQSISAPAHSGPEWIAPEIDCRPGA